MKRAFLSFRSEDLMQVRGVRLMAYNAALDFDFYDESVKVEIDSTDAEYIKRVIRAKIDRASITICLISGPTYLSK